MNNRPKRNTPAGEAPQRAIYILSIPIRSEIFSVGFSCGKVTEWKGMGKGVSWHNTQFCDLKSTRAIRQDRWKPITNGKRNSTPAIPTLTPAGASTISTSSSRRDAITTSFKAALNKLAVAPAGTVPGLWIR